MNTGQILSIYPWKVPTSQKTSVIKVSAVAWQWATEVISLRNNLTINPVTWAYFMSVVSQEAQLEY